MLNRMIFCTIAAAALSAALLPRAAAAADYYGGDEGRAPAFHGRDDGGLDDDRAPFARGQFFHPARPGHGPVVFDERDPERRRGRPVYGYGGPDERFDRPVHGERPPLLVERPNDRGAGFGRGEGPGWGPDEDGPDEGGSAGHALPYRAVSAPFGPAYGGRPAVPEEGCTVERSRSTTPAGWQKIVTHRVCYRR